MAPVRWHLTSARGGIVLRADAFEKHFVSRHAERQAESAIAVVGIEPVVSGLEHEARGDENAFMASSADLEVNFVLALELDFAVVELAREEHRAIDADERVTVETVVFRSVEFRCLNFGLCRHTFPSGIRAWNAESGLNGYGSLLLSWSLGQQGRVL